MPCLPPPITTSKLQLKYRTTITEDHLMTRWKAFLYLRIWRGSHVKNGWRGGGTEGAGPALIVWQLRTRGISQLLRYPLRSESVSVPHQAPQPMALVKGRSPHNIWQWKPVGIVAKWDRGLLEFQIFLLKGPCTWSLTHRLTHLELQWRKSSLKSTRDIWEGAGLSSFRVRS